LPEEIIKRLGLPEFAGTINSSDLAWETATKYHDLKLTTSSAHPRRKHEKKPTLSPIVHTPS